MAAFQPPPTYAEVVLYDKTAKDSVTLLASAKFNPIWLKWFLDLTKNLTGTGAGSVTNLSFVNANGISGSVANPTTTPALTLALGAITPSSVTLNAMTLSSGTPNVLDIVGTGNSRTTAIHLNPGTGTLPTGTITEVVLARTNAQAFGGNYGRWSFTTLGSANGNASGLYGEYGGTVTYAPFIFNLGIENPVATFTSYEYMRLMDSPNLGCVAFGLSAASQLDVIQLYGQTQSGAGFKPSHGLLWQASTNDGSAHVVDWHAFNNTTSNAGASTFTLQRRIDGGAWATKLSLTDGGTLTVSPLICTTIAASGLVSANLGLTVAGANFTSRGITDAATSTALSLDSSGRITQPSQPSFLAYNSTLRSNVTGNAVTATVTFDTEIADRGSNFASNTFTAPITGLYRLSATIGLDSITGTNTDARLDIVTSNRTYSYAFNPGNAEASAVLGVACASFSVLADMDAADTALVQITVWQGTQTIGIQANPYTYFSGNLTA